MGKFRTQIQQKKKLSRLTDRGKEKVKKGKHLRQKTSNKHKVSNKHSSDESDFEIAKGDEVAKQETSGLKRGIDVITAEKVKTRNEKQKKSGGFKSMGLSNPVYKGVFHKGYKIPTPIQRKTIPVIMDGKDVVAMGRTGSGKTAAFLIPMFERLKVHSSQGVRALILSPTRELAVQTLKFTKELGKYTDLKFSLILGGDSMENQFAAFHQNPDICIATPGRFLHLLVEMDINRLDTVEYIVFDEADRLFEMGFSEQLQEIIRRLPDSRQTILFSATLPKLLVDFASAGLTDPTLIRLDVDTKVSEELKMTFCLLRPEDKIACLLYILQNLISTEEQSVIFVSTKHHVDYLKELLSSAGMNCSYIYSSLDQTARKINLAKFCKKISMLLIVTDIAARGIDIPMLDNVINFDFPAKPKLFVHRVGRTARAGRSGFAYSLLVKDELPYLFDLHLFLGRPVKFANSTMCRDADSVIGTVPQAVLSIQQDYIKYLSERTFNLSSMQKVMVNGYKQFLKARETASTESVKRAKALDLTTLYTHPLIAGNEEASSKSMSQLLSDLQQHKPNLTVFETMRTKKSKEKECVMQLKRQQHSSVIEKQKLQQKEKREKERILISQDGVKDDIATVVNESYIADSVPVKNKGFKTRDYVLFNSKDHHAEKGLNITSFKKEASNISVELATDDSSLLTKCLAAKKWDRKRKKYVSTGVGKTKRIKTESGSYIAASYKSKRYENWVRVNNMSQLRNDDDTTQRQSMTREGKRLEGKNRRLFGNGKKLGNGVLKTKDQMIKNRIHADAKKVLQRKYKKKGRRT